MNATSARIAAKILNDTSKAALLRLAQTIGAASAFCTDTSVHFRYTDENTGEVCGVAYSVDSEDRVSMRCTSGPDKGKRYDNIFRLDELLDAQAA